MNQTLNLYYLAKNDVIGTRHKQIALKFMLNLVLENKMHKILTILFCKLGKRGRFVFQLYKETCCVYKINCYFTLNVTDMNR